MYDGNPGEIYFGSSQREVRVNKGSSYQESTVFIGSKITGKAFKLQKEIPKLLCGWLKGSGKTNVRYPMPFWLLDQLHLFFFFFFFNIIIITFLSLFFFSWYLSVYHHYYHDHLYYHYYYYYYYHNLAGRQTVTSRSID